MNVLQADELLDMGTWDEHSKLYLIFDRSLTAIILGHATHTIDWLNSILTASEKNDNTIHMAFGLAYFSLSNYNSAEYHLLQALSSPKSKWEEWWAKDIFR